MSILTRYLLARMTAALVVALSLLAGLLWILQALRLGHHLVGGTPSGAGLLAARLLLFSLPTLLLFSIPAALAAAVLYTLDQLCAAGELDAMRSAGATPLQLALPAGLLCLAAAAAALLAARLERPALDRLLVTARDAAAHTLVLGARAGRFHELPGGAVLYVERRLAGGTGQARLQNLLLARDDALVVARGGTLQVRGARLSLQLTDGELHLGGAGRLSRLRFKTLEQSLDLGRALEQRFGFLGGRRDHRSPAAAMALGLLACVVGLSRGSRLRRGVGGLALTVAYLGAGLGLEQVTGGGPLLLAGGVGAGCLAWLAWASRRGGASRRRRPG